MQFFSEFWGYIGSIEPTWWWELLLGLSIGIWGLFFPPWRSRAKVEFLVLPRPAAREEPEGWSEFEVFDDKSAPALVKITNKGSRQITLDRVVLDYGSKKNVQLSGFVLESARRDGRFDPFPLGVNKACRYQAAIPDEAFGKNARIKFFFQNKALPVNLKFV